MNVALSISLVSLARLLNIVVRVALSSIGNVQRTLKSTRAPSASTK